MYRVKLYRTNELTRQGIPREDPQIFEVTLDGKKIGSRKQEEENPMMGGVDELNSYNPFSGAGAGYGGDYGGMFGVDTYMAQTREIMELKEKIKALEHKLEMTEFTHKHEMTRLFDKHRQELKEAKDGNALLGQGLGALMSKMGLDGE